MKYKVLSNQDAAKLGPDYEHLIDGWDNHFCCIILFDNNDKPIKLIGTDGGEPEDQTLYRDWKWVVDALNEAYNLGYTKGIKDSKPEA